MDDHRHDADGRVIIEAPADIPPAVAEVEAVEVAVSADVEIAKINADRDLAIGKMDLKREEMWQESRVAELEGQLRGVRETLATLVPEPEPAPAPEPIVVADPPVDDIAPAPEPVEAAEPAKKKSSGFFGPAYH